MGAVIASRDPFAGQQVMLAPEARTSIGGMFAASWRMSRLLNQTDSAFRAEHEALDDLAQALGADAGAEQQRFRAAEAAALRPGGSRPRNYERSWRLEPLLAEVRARRAQDAHALPGLPADAAGYETWLATRVQSEVSDLGQKLDRPQPGGWVGSLGGGMAAGFTDPVNLLLMPLGASAGAGILRTALTEGALGAASVAVTAPVVADWRAQVGLDYTAAEFFENMAYAAAGSALFGAAIKAVPRLGTVARKVANLSRRELIAEFDRLEVKTPEAQAARDLLGAAEDTAASNPFGDLPAAREDHVARLQESVAAIAEGRAPDMPDRPLMPVTGGLKVFSGADMEARARLIDPVAFAQRDNLLTRQTSFREWIADFQAQRAAPIEAEIADLQGRMETATPRLAKKYQARIEALEAEVQAARSGDTPDMAKVRGELQQVDYALRDLGQRIDAATRQARRELDAEIETAPVRAKVIDATLRALRRESGGEARAILYRAQDGAGRDALDAAVRTVHAGGDVGKASAGLADALRALPDAARPRPQADAPSSPRTSEGGPQTSGQARLESFSDPARGGAEAQSRQLEVEAREDLMRNPDAEDVVPVNPENGEAMATRDLLDEFARDEQAIAHLETCVAGGAA